MDSFRNKQKRRKISIFAFGMFLFSASFAGESESFSIMLSQNEQNALAHALGLRKEELGDVYDQVSSLEKQDTILFLSGIIYLTADKWALWLNDQVINNKNAFPGILLKDVEPDAVTFTINGEKKNITLKLNQSYSYGQKRVVDGDARLKEGIIVKG